MNTNVNSLQNYLTEVKMYKLSLTEEREDLIFREFRAQYIKHSARMASDEYYNADSAAWIDYYNGRMKHLKEVAEECFKQDIEDSRDNIAAGKGINVEEYLKEIGL